MYAAPFLPSRLMGCTPDLALRPFRGLRKPTICIPRSVASWILPSYSTVDYVDWGRDNMPGPDDDTPVSMGETGRLKLNIIGKFSASVDGHEVALSRKAQALLSYMLLTSSRQLSRTKLVGLLWSEKEDSLAKGSLRQSLS